MKLLAREGKKPEPTLKAKTSKPRSRRLKILLALNLILLAGVGMATWKNPDWWRLPLLRLGFDFTRRVKPADAVAEKIVAAAKSQQGTFYAAGYAKIGYPGGDLSADRGACSDVVVRALRGAGFDLQKLIHDDISKNWKAYPNHWCLAAPDTNIDHRRVPNQMVFFARHGQKLTNALTKDSREQWQPGDVVCWKTGPKRWHTGVLSDGVNRSGWPMVVHNGSICVEADCLTRWPIIGHFRFPERQAIGPGS